MSHTAMFKFGRPFHILEFFSTFKINLYHTFKLLSRSVRVGTGIGNLKWPKYSVSCDQSDEMFPFRSGTDFLGLSKITPVSTEKS